MSPPKDLLSILKTRREYCRAMLALAQHQKSLILENRTTDLIQVLAQKQRVLDGLSRLNQLEGEWKKNGPPLTATQHAEADGVRVEAESLYQEIRCVEQVGAEELMRRRDALQNQLREMGEVADALPSSPCEDDVPRSLFLDVSR